MPLVDALNFKLSQRASLDNCAPAISSSKSCLAQEHNTMTRPGLQPGPFDPESSALTIRPPRLSSCTRENCYDSMAEMIDCILH